MVKQAIVEREKDITERNLLRIEEIKIRKTEQKNRLIAKIHRKKKQGRISQFLAYCLLE